MITDKLQFDAVISSDLHRAVASAETLFENRLKIIWDERLRECNYGRYNGFPSLVVEPLQPKHIHHPFPEGESYEQVRQRVGELLDELRVEYAGGHVGFMSHKAPQLALDVLLNEKSWEEAFSGDWRRTGSWQPGWEYLVGS
jgi:broad specificity phosphatase PhoE